MQKRPTKAELRQQLEEALQQFIKDGGNIRQMPRGASGLIDGRYNSLAFDKPQTSRTDLTNVLNTIDQRKEQKKLSSNTAKSRTHRPTKKVIYDDFGEPVRIVWE